MKLPFSLALAAGALLTLGACVDTSSDYTGPTGPASGAVSSGAGFGTDPGSVSAGGASLDSGNNGGGSSHGGGVGQ